MPRTPTISTTHPDFPGLTLTYAHTSVLEWRASYGRINRGQLLKLAEAGRVWMRCQYHYTDDYAWDAATNYGRTGWFRVAIAPEWPDYPATEAEREARMRAYRAWEDSARAAGCGIMRRDQFRGSTGSASVEHRRGERPRARLSVYSGLSYELRTTPPDPVDAALDDDAARLEAAAGAAWMNWWTGRECCAARAAHQPIPETPADVAAAMDRARRARALADAIARPAAEVPA